MNLKFNYLVKILIIIISLISFVNSSKILSRKRRFLAFPPGSSFSCAICTTIGSIGNPDVNFLSYALNWGVSYNLPNDTWVIQSAHGFNNPVEPSNPVEQKKRFRRGIYRNFEIAINSMGYDGRDCVLRAICDSSHYLYGRTGNMIEEIFKLIFSYPGTKMSINEYNDNHNINDENHHYYWKAFLLGQKQRKLNEYDFNICHFNYPRCSFSLLELALGKHSVKTKIKY